MWGLKKQHMVGNEGKAIELYISEYAKSYLYTYLCSPVYKLTKKLTSCYWHPLTAIICTGMYLHPPSTLLRLSASRFCGKTVCSSNYSTWQTCSWSFTFLVSGLHRVSLCHGRNKILARLRSPALETRLASALEMSCFICRVRQLWFISSNI